jgi:hypothetical protein
MVDFIVSSLFMALAILACRQSWKDFQFHLGHIPLLLRQGLSEDISKVGRDGVPLWSSIVHGLGKTLRALQTDACDLYFEALL